MKERTFYLCSLFTSLLGILGLFILSFYVHYPLTAIQDLDEDLVGKTVRVHAELVSFQNKEKISLLQVADETGEISVLLYQNENIPFKKHMPLEIVGTVQNYHCQLEIQAEHISLLDL